MEPHAKNSWDVVPSDLPKIAAGTMVVRDVAPPDASESNKERVTGGKLEVPAWLIVGEAVWALRKAGLPRVEATVLALGEGLALVRYDDDGQDWLPWAVLEPKPVLPG